MDDEVRYEGHAIINSWFGRKLTYEQVARFAQNYAPDSPYVNINSTNWQEYFFINKNAQLSNLTSMDPVTRTSTMAYLSIAPFPGSIVFTQIDRKDIEDSPRFRFAGAPHFDEITIGLIKQGQYKKQLFIEITNDGYPSGNACGNAELLPEKYQSYEGIKQYVFGRDFSIYEPITEKMFSERMTELFNDIGH